MFGAIYTGLSGLLAYSDGLQTISNNVANLNTSGFKATSVRFSDQFNSGNGAVGLFGSGAQGGGVRLDDLQVSFQQGDLRQSDDGLDLAIDGSGFLLLLDGDRTLYTRTGSFIVDNEGFIVLEGTDYRLAVLDDAGRAVAVNIDSNRTNAPVATTTIRFADNLSSTATEQIISDLVVFDANGVEHVWQVRFARDGDAGGNAWDVIVTNDEDEEIGTQRLSFTQGEVDADSSQLVFDDPNNDGLSVTLDFSENVTSFSSGELSTLRAAGIDGNGIGTITNVTVNGQGRVEIRYSNGETEDIAAVAIADFRDQQQLQRADDGLFIHDGRGERRLVASDDPAAGRVVAGRLEASNVDLSEQFGELILIQRGFQASSQIVSVSNDMIQQLFGIRGQ